VLATPEPPMKEWELDRGQVDFAPGTGRQILLRPLGLAFRGENEWATARGIFRRFLSLDGAGPTVLLRFVRRYGCLGLYDDGVPWTAAPTVGWAHREPVEAYRRYARLAAAVLRTAVLLGGPGRDDDAQVFAADLAVVEEHWRWWEQRRNEYLKRHRFEIPMLGCVPLGNLATEGRGDRRWEPADYLRTMVVEGVVNWWLGTSGAGPWLVARLPFGWSLVTDVRGPWGAIGLCLAAAVQREAGGGSCANCGAAVRYGRRPALRRFAWCTRPECQRAKWRGEKRKQRAPVGRTGRR